MRKLLTICATLGTLCGLAVADTWTGTVLNEQCVDHHANRACKARPSSRAFVIDVNGTNYRLDYTTNQNIRSSLLENRKLTKNSPVTATLTGHMRTDGKIDAHTIAVQ